MSSLHYHIMNEATVEDAGLIGIKLGDLENEKSNDYVLTPSRSVGMAKQEYAGAPAEENSKCLTAELLSELERDRELEVQIKTRLGGLK